MDLVLDGNGPLYGQLARAMKAAMASGRLVDGTRLPASRELAHDLNLSRTTVVAAYEQLRAEGYLDGRVGSGSYLRSPWPGAMRRLPQHGVVPQSEFSRRGRRIHDPDELFGRRLPGMRHAFQFGLPIINNRLTSQWSRELAKASPYTRPNYPAPQGLLRLREAICGHIVKTRGVVCLPEDLLIVNGAQQAMSLMARVLVDDGDEVVLEEPHYFGVRKIMELHGARLTGVPVDASGLQVEGLPDRSVKLICLTPSHQFPTGAILSGTRRAALLERTRQNAEWICEDDYDGEFRHDAVAVEALQSMDRDGRVIYIGSFSKTLFPALRLGYIIMPPGLRRDLITAKWADDFATSSVEQAALASLISSGAYERHLRVVTRKLAERRQVLVDSLREQCGGRIDIVDCRSGMHLLIWIKGMDRAGGTALVRRAAERRLGLYAVDSCYLSPPDRAGLIMGFSAMSPREIIGAVKVFAECLAEVSGSSAKSRHLFLAHSSPGACAGITGGSHD